MDLVYFHIQLKLLKKAEGEFEPAVDHEVEGMVHLLELVASEDFRANNLRDNYEEFWVTF